MINDSTFYLLSVPADTQPADKFQSHNECYFSGQDKLKIKFKNTEIKYP